MAPLPPELTEPPVPERRREGVALAQALEEVRQLQEAATQLATAVVTNRHELHAAEARVGRQIRWTVGTAAVLYLLLVIFGFVLAGNMTTSLVKAVTRGHATLECLLSKSEAQRTTSTEALTDCRQAAEVNAP